jgi:hypothetical protein
LHETTAAERLIHLLLFIAAAGALGTTALALVDRLVADRESPAVKFRYVALSVGLFVALFGVERLYHAVT